MSDIVERLRARVPAHVAELSIFTEAADVIAAKDAEIKRIQELVTSSEQERYRAVGVLVAKDAEICKLREALTKAADQLDRVHDDAFKQAGGYGLSAADGRSFSCFELNQCSTAAHAARAVLKGGEA